MKTLCKGCCCLIAAFAAFGADAGLPPGWRELQYVTADGTQYLDTGFRLTADEWDYILDGAIEKDGGYGGVNNYLNFEARLCGADGKRHEFHFSLGSDFKGTLYLDGATKKKLGGSSGEGSVIGLLVMGQGDGFMSTDPQYVQKGDVYSFVLKKNGGVVQHLVPAMDPDGVACFYDIQQNRPFYSAGSAAFVAGTPVVEYEIAPVPRQLLEDFGQAMEPELFLTNKATQVELVRNKDYTVTYENNTDEGTATAHVAGIGYYAGENASVDFEVVTSYALYKHLEYVKGTGTQYVNTGIVLTDKAWLYELDATIVADNSYSGNNPSLYFQANSKYGIDGTRRNVKVTRKEGGDSRGVGSLIAVFAMGLSPTKIGDLGMKGDIYSFQLSEEGVLLMDLAPILDNNDVACFYDKVQMKRFYSEGADHFVAGPVRSELEIDPIPPQRVVGGVAATPEVSVRSLGTGLPLRLHEDYEVSYENNDKPGIATVRVTGKGAYADSLENSAEFVVDTVFCVTADAKTTGGGLTWADAMPFSNAVAAASAVTDVPCEIWVAGDVAVPLAPEAQTWSAQSVSIRGGFAGSELSPESRLPGAASVLDGGAEAEKILEFVNAGSVVLERLVFKSATARALRKTGSGSLSVIDCRFVSNGLGWNSQSGQGRACYVAGNGSSTECVFSNCVFSGNCMARSSCNGAGGAIYGESVKRLMIEDCLFVTNGILPTAGIGASTPGAQTRGTCIQIQDCSLRMRNSHFRGNRGKIANGVGGIVAIRQSCSGSVIENCSFAGSSDGNGTADVSSETGICGGAVVIQMRQPEDTITFNNCTIAYNLADAPLVPGGLDVLRGVVNVSNSVICANRCGKFGQVGADISVRDGGRLHLSYCHLTAGDPATGRPTAACVSETNEGLVTFDHLTFGDPKLKTRVVTFNGCIRTEGDYTYLDNSQAGVDRRCGFDLHERRSSPLVDAGDPASDYSKEPLPNGGRVNLGAYGNTAEAAMTKNNGLILMVK